MPDCPSCGFNNQQGLDLSKPLLTTCANCGRCYPVEEPVCDYCGSTKRTNRKGGERSKFPSSGSGLTGIGTATKQFDNKIKVCIKCGVKLDNADIACKSCGSSAFIWEELEAEDTSKTPERNANWIKQGRPVNEHIRSQFPNGIPNDWGQLALVNLEDLFRKNILDLFPSNGKVFNVGNEARLLAKVGGSEQVLFNFKERIQKKDLGIRVSYYEYPTYPLIYILLQTKPFKNFASQSIEIIADFTEVNFQEFSIVLHRNKSMFIDIVDEHNKNIASERVEVDKDLCGNIIEYINRANKVFEQIAIPNRDFSKAGQLFCNEHPLPILQSTIDNGIDNLGTQNLLSEGTIFYKHTKWWKIWDRIIRRAIGLQAHSKKQPDLAPRKRSKI